MLCVRVPVEVRDVVHLAAEVGGVSVQEWVSRVVKREATLVLLRETPVSSGSEE